MKKNTSLPLLICGAALLVSAVMITLSLISNEKTKYYFNATEKTTAVVQKNIEIKAIASEILKTRQKQFDRATIQSEYLGRFEGYKTQPTAFFTFDDGPNESALKMAEYLYSEGIGATFFSICNYAETEEKAEILKKITDMGFTIGLHGYYHDMKIYNGFEAFMQDLQSAQTILKEKGIPQAKLLRFPWTSGSAAETLYSKTGNERAYNKIREILSDTGYSVVDFEISGNDWTGEATVESIIADTLAGGDYVLAKPFKAGVILLHCTPASADALPEIVRGLKEKGYVFDTLEEEDFPYYLLNN